MDFSAKIMAAERFKVRNACRLTRIFKDFSWLSRHRQPCSAWVSLNQVRICLIS